MWIVYCMGSRSRLTCGQVIDIETGAFGRGGKRRHCRGKLIVSNIVEKYLPGPFCLAHVDQISIRTFGAIWLHTSRACRVPYKARRRSKLHVRRGRDVIDGLFAFAAMCRKNCVKRGYLLKPKILR